MLNNNIKFLENLLDIAVAAKIISHKDSKVKFNEIKKFEQNKGLVIKETKPESCLLKFKDAADTDEDIEVANAIAATDTDENIEEEDVDVYCIYCYDNCYMCDYYECDYYDWCNKIGKEYANEAAEFCSDCDNCSHYDDCNKVANAIAGANAEYVAECAAEYAAAEYAAEYAYHEKV